MPTYSSTINSRSERMVNHQVSGVTHPRSVVPERILTQTQMLDAYGSPTVDWTRWTRA